MSEVSPQPWEVWHARFDFDDGKGYKYQPVIVLGAMMLCPSLLAGNVPSEIWSMWAAVS